MKDTAEFLSNKNEWVAIFDALEIPKTADYNFNLEGAERWLVVCRGGNTRSVAVAMLLKYKYGKDALACSIEKNSKSTMQMLIKWADRIMVTELDHYEYLRRFTPMVRFMDLTCTERLRSHPYEIEFLKQVDAKLKYFLNPEENQIARTASSNQ